MAPAAFTTGSPRAPSPTAVMALLPALLLLMGTPAPATAAYYSGWYFRTDHGCTATAETCPTLPAHVSAASGGEYSTNSNAFVQCSSSVAGKTCATDGSATWGANWASDTSSSDTQVFSFVQDHNKWGMTIAPYASIHHRDCALNSITMTRESVPTGCFAYTTRSFTWSGSASCIPGASELVFHMTIYTGTAEVCVYTTADASLWGIPPPANGVGISFRATSRNANVNIVQYWRARQGSREMGLFDQLDGNTGSSNGRKTVTSAGMEMYTPSCREGWYAYGHGCRECPAGRAGLSKFLAGVDDCTECSPGTFTTDPGQTSCSNCPAGYRSTVTGLSVSCEQPAYLCEAGYYSRGTGRTTCTWCGDGTCGRCPAGRYRTSGMPGNTCETCNAFDPTCEECDPTSNVISLLEDVHGTPTHCKIGTCVTAGDHRPASNAADTIAQCQVCQPQSSASVWTQISDGARSCDDNNLCTHTDRCKDNAGDKGCFGTPYTCLNTKTVTVDADCEDCDGLGNCPANPSKGCVFGSGPSRVCGCFIDGVCYADGSHHPDPQLSQCNKCDRSKSLTEWTPLKDIQCDDGDKCTHTDVCALIPYAAEASQSTRKWQCAGTGFTCEFPICTNQASWRDACSGKAPPLQCDQQTYYSPGDAHECRAVDTASCVLSQTCTGQGACPAVQYKDPDVQASGLVLSHETLSPPAVMASGDAITVWPEPKYIRMTLPSPTYQCGGLHYSAYIISDTSVNCNSATLTAANSEIPHIDVTDNAGVTTIRLDQCDTGVVLNSCTWTTSPLLGSSFHIAVEVKTSLDSPGVPQTVTRMCINNVVFDNTPPALPLLQPGEAYVTNLDPATFTPADFHHQDRLSFTWKPFVDPESAWPHNQLAYRAEVHYTTTVLQTVFGIPTLTRVARSWLSDWFSASDLLFASPRGRLELTTTPSLVLTYGRAYFVEIHAQNAAGLTFKYKNTVSAMSDNTAPWAAVLHDGPAPPESSDQHVFDLIGLSGNCVEVHWGGGFRDSIGNDPANNNIESYVWNVTSVATVGSTRVEAFVTQQTLTPDQVTLHVGMYGARWCKPGVTQLVDQGLTVFSTVLATNVAGLSVTASTDGMLFDASPPVVNSTLPLGVLGRDSADRYWRADGNGTHRFQWAIADPEWPAQLTYAWTVRVTDNAGTRTIATGTGADPDTTDGFHKTNIVFQHGSVIHTTITATSPAALTSTATVPDVHVDRTPPSGLEVYVVDTSRIMPLGSVDAVGYHPAVRTRGCVDPESGVRRVVVRLYDTSCGGCAPLWTQFHPWGGDQETAVPPGVSLVDGTRYQFEATCEAGSTTTMVRSTEFWYDSRGPVPGTAVAGHPNEAPLEFQCTAEQASAWWEGFDGRSPGIEAYTVSLVRETGNVEVHTQTFNDTVLRTTFDLRGAQLHHNTRYRFQVTAHSAASGIESSPAVSDTFLVDLTPPEVGVLHVRLTNGSRRVDLTWDNAWRDDESQIAKFRWWVGTTNTSADIYGPATVQATDLSATALVPPDIRSHFTVFITLEAVNRAGCASSDYVVDRDNRFLDFSNATALDAWQGRYSSLTERQRLQGLFSKRTSGVRSWWYNISDDQGVENFRVAYVRVNSTRGYDPNCTRVISGGYHDAPGYGKGTFRIMEDTIVPNGQSFAGLIPGEAYVTYVQGNKGTAVGQAFCSPGFTVDTDAAVARTVEVLACTPAVGVPAGVPASEVYSSNGLTYMVTEQDREPMACHTHAAAAPQWDQFVDLESGVVQYVWAVGTKPGGAQATPFQVFAPRDVHTLAPNETTSLANVTSSHGVDFVTWRDLDRLTEGQTYYATVVALTGAGRNTTSVSRPFWIDTTPPLVLSPTTIGGPGVEPRPVAHKPVVDHHAAYPAIPLRPQPTHRSDKSWFVPFGAASISCGWGPVADHESGIASIEVVLLRNGDVEEVTKWVALDPLTDAPGLNGTTTFLASEATGGAFAASQWYQCMVLVTSMANHTTVSISEGLVIESTAPFVGVVHDGPLTTFVDTDIDFQANNDTLRAHWTGFIDFESTIDHYELAVGTTPGGADVVARYNVGRFNSWTLDPTHLLQRLHPGLTYHVAVWAHNVAGMTVLGTSDGVTIGNGPAVPIEAGWVSMRGVPLPTDRTTCGCTISGAEFSVREGRCRCPSSKALNFTMSPTGAQYACVADSTVAVTFAGDSPSQTSARHSAMFGAAGIRAHVAQPEVTLGRCADVTQDPTLTFDEALVAGPNHTCVCGPGHYRILPVDTCLPCPYGTYKWIPGDSPHLCRPCFFGASAYVRTSFKAKSPPSVVGATPGLTGMEYVLGEGPEGAQYTSGAVVVDPDAVHEGSLVQVIATVPADQDARITVHTFPTFDDAVPGPTSSAAVPQLDLTPPTAGWVTIGAAEGGVRYQGNDTHFACRWGGFSEDDSGVAKLEVAFGTTPGDSNIVAYYEPSTTDVTALAELGADTAVAPAPPTPKGGVSPVYASVRVTNGIGEYSTVSSPPMFIDTAPPVVHDVWLASEVDLATHSRLVAMPTPAHAAAWPYTDRLRVVWRVEDVGELAVTTPAIPYVRAGSSGVIAIKWAIGLSTDIESVREFTLVPQSVAPGAHVEGIKLEHGQQYVVSVVAQDGLGRWSDPVSSAPFVIDAAPPSEGRVALLGSGANLVAQYGVANTIFQLVPAPDLTYVPLSSNVSAVGVPTPPYSTHNGEDDVVVSFDWEVAISGLSSCRVRVGTGVESVQLVPSIIPSAPCAGGTQSIGSLSQLTHGTVFWAHMEVTSEAGLSSITTSPPVVIDRTPPVAPSGLWLDVANSVTMTREESSGFPDFIRDWYLQSRGADASPITFTDSTIYYDALQGPLDSGIGLSWSHWGEDLSQVVRYEVALQVVNVSVWGWTVPVFSPCGNTGLGLCPSWSADLVLDDEAAGSVLLPPNATMSTTVMIGDPFDRLVFEYYGLPARVVLRAINAAGLASETVSVNIIADRTPPAVSNVRVGPRLIDIPGYPHQSFQGNLTSIHAAWDVAEYETPVTLVEWAIVMTDFTTSESIVWQYDLAANPDVWFVWQGWTQLQPGATCASTTAVSLFRGYWNRVLVRACNVLGQCSSVQSSPFFVADDTPPQPGRLYVGAARRVLATNPAAGATQCRCTLTNAVPVADDDGVGSTGECLCDAGYFFNSTTGACARCAAGQFKASPGNDVADCQTCPVGLEPTASQNRCQCTGGSSQVHDVDSNTCICAPGYGKHVNGSCTACLPGWAKVSAGDWECSPCPHSTVAPVGQAATLCTCDAAGEVFVPNNATGYAAASAGSCQCQAGFFNNSFLNSCVQCPRGTFKPNPGNSGVDCRRCPAVAEAGQTANSCVCPQGFTFNAITAKCETSVAPLCAADGRACVDVQLAIAEAKRLQQQHDVAAAKQVTATNTVESHVVAKVVADSAAAFDSKVDLAVVPDDQPLVVPQPGRLKLTPAVCSSCTGTCVDDVPYVGANLPLQVRWDGFTEVETWVAPWSLAIAIGTVPYGQQLKPFTLVSELARIPGTEGQNGVDDGWAGTAVIDFPPTLHMNHTNPVFATLRYANYGGVEAVSTEWVGVVDATPPAACTIVPKGGVLYHPVNSDPVWIMPPDAPLEATVTGCTDPETGVARLEWRVALQATGELTVWPDTNFTAAHRGEPARKYTDAAGDVVFGLEGLHAQNVSSYQTPFVSHYFVATVWNGAGLYTTLVSSGFYADATAPVPGVVRDGAQVGKDMSCGVIQVDSSVKHAVLGANWDPFMEERTDPVLYKWALGTACGLDDVMPFTDVVPDSGVLTSDTVAEFEPVLSASANVSLLHDWAETLESSDPRLLEHVYHGNGASSVFVVATVRGYNSVGVYSEACSDGTRLMVAECVALSESDDASLPRNTLRKFLCGQHRDFLCMPVQTYNPSVTN